MAKRITCIIILCLVIFTITNNNCFGASKVTWSVSGQVRLGSGAGFIFLGYYYTSNDYDSLAATCYILGGLLIAVGIAEMFQEKDPFYEQRYFQSPKFRFVAKNNYIGIEAIRSF